MCKRNKHVQYTHCLWAPHISVCLNASPKLGNLGSHSIPFFIVFELFSALQLHFYIIEFLRYRNQVMAMFHSDTIKKNPVGLIPTTNTWTYSIDSALWVFIQIINYVFYWKCFSFIASGYLLGYLLSSWFITEMINSDTRVGQYAHRTKTNKSQLKYNFCFFFNKIYKKNKFKEI